MPLLSYLHPTTQTTLEMVTFSTILDSVRKTGRLLVVDTSWITCGMSAEIAALAAEKAFAALKRPIKRMGMAPAVCPVSKPLENLFYPNTKTIAAEAFALMERRFPAGPAPEPASTFKGPF